jgi:muramoyltetrapeptide carboxypeptidase
MTGGVPAKTPEIESILELDLLVSCLHYTSAYVSFCNAERSLQVDADTLSFVEVTLVGPIKPERIRKGDSVGVFSPSWPVTPDVRNQFDKGVESLKALGLKVRLAEHALGQHYYSAGTRQDRLEDLHSLWHDPEVRMLLMTQGGSTAMHLLDGIDYNLFKEDPKIIAGISDGTSILNAIYAKTGLVTFHGPDLMWTFGLDMSPKIQENVNKTFFEGEVGELRPNERWKHEKKPDIEYHGWKCLRQGKTSGRLIGGHIRVLANTILAGYGPDFDGAILFLEGTDSVALTDRVITALRLRGVFDEIGGVILGWFDESELEEKELTRPVSEAFLEITSDYEFPVLEIGDLGHNVENYVFPIGCKATVDATNKRISIDESPVR